MVNYDQCMRDLEELGKALEPLESVLGTTGNPTKGANKGVTKITANSSDGKVSFGVEYSDVTADTNKYAFSIAATGKAAVGGGGIKDITYNAATKKYDIKYVDKDGHEMTAYLDAKPGDKGADGKDNSGTEFYSNGFCKKKSSVTGVSGSATGFTAAITGMSAGVTAYSATVDVISTGIAGLYDCATVFGSDSDVVENKSTGVKNDLKVDETLMSPADQNKGVSEFKKENVKNTDELLETKSTEMDMNVSTGDKIENNHTTGEVNS